MYTRISKLDRPALVTNPDLFTRYSQHVHSYIKQLVPRRNLKAAYKVETIKQGIEDMFTEYKDKLMEDVDLPLRVKGLKIGSDPGDDDGASIISSEGDSSLLYDLKDAKSAYPKYTRTNSGESQVDLMSPTSTMPELDGSNASTLTLSELDATTPIAELDASSPLVELPADTKIAELGDSNRRAHEPRSMV
jgi:hypothetical protein